MFQLSKLWRKSEESLETIPADTGAAFLLADTGVRCPSWAGVFLLL